MKRFIISCLLLTISIATGCAENTDNSVSDMTAESIVIPTHIHDENASFCMDNVLFVATLQQYHDTDIMYYFVVTNDGNVFTMENNNYEDNYEFSKKFGYRDDSALALAENLENIGSISQTDTEEISEYISKINPESEYYDYERDNMGMLPDVIPNIYYNYKFYISDGAEKSVFKIMDGSDEEGAYYETYDKNALSAFELIVENQLYIDWKEKIN